MESIYNIIYTLKETYSQVYIYTISINPIIPRYCNILQHSVRRPLATDETQWSWRGALRSRGAGEKCVRSLSGGLLWRL